LHPLPVEGQNNLKSWAPRELSERPPRLVNSTVQENNEFFKNFPGTEDILKVS